MASEKARIAKDKGNTAFKAGDYPTAIGHYTSAILADSNDHTFPLNRAAAYLKLGKNHDAERDCTAVLKLSPNNVKALFRRGQALLGLDRLTDARADLDAIIKLEPANEAVKQELANIDKLIVQRQSKQRTSSRPGKPPSNIVQEPAADHPKRRRIPIKIIEPNEWKPSKPTAPIIDARESEDVEKTDFLTPVSSRSIPSTGKQTPEVLAAPKGPPSPSSAEKPRSFMDAKQARENAKPGRVGGGIFRPSGQHTLVTQKPSAPSSSPREIADPSPGITIPKLNAIGSNVNNAPLTKPPMTLFQFTRSWESLGSDDARWELISGIPPSSIPRMFQNSLEPSLLASILGTFRHVVDQAHNDDDRLYGRIREYMVSLQKVQRFGTVLLFMSKDEKQLLDGLWNTLQNYGHS